MQYRKLSADKIFNGLHWINEGAVLVVNEKGEIRDIVSRENAGDDIEHLKGILVPGLVNCHCHLELSHLKNVIPPHTGLIDFLLTVIKKRNVPVAEIHQEIENAEKELAENGTVAVADISNTDHAFEVKKNSQLWWHNLIEVINLHDNKLEKQWENYMAILEQHRKHDTRFASSGLTPHAPYSVSKATFKKLNEETRASIISIHNQETNAENELFKTGQGEFLKLYNALGETNSPLVTSGKSSIQTWLPHFTNRQTILLVHNTFIAEEDIVFANEHSAVHGLQLVYCLCPNANLYIENTLPPVDVLMRHNCKIVLGTDSYSSNWQLNIVSEIKTIHEHFPHIALETILQWATSSGAEVLQLNSMLGHFERGKIPGMVLLETDLLNKITGRSKRII